jgi:hypothetical protein
MQVAFSGLHQWCAPSLGDVEKLPGPQRGAIKTVFGLDISYLRRLERLPAQTRLLGVSSRRHLRRALADRGQPLAST